MSRLVGDSRLAATAQAYESCLKPNSRPRVTLHDELLLLPTSHGYIAGSNNGKSPYTPITIKMAMTTANTQWVCRTCRPHVLTDAITISIRLKMTAVCAALTRSLLHRAIVIVSLTDCAEHDRTISGRPARNRSTVNDTPINTSVLMATTRRTCLGRMDGVARMVALLCLLLTNR